MPTPIGDQFSNEPERHWTDRWVDKLSTMSNDERRGDRSVKYEKSDLSAWVQRSMFSPAPFPTQWLMGHDTHLEHHDQIWDVNPEVARRQKIFRRPKDAPPAFEVNTKHAEYMHDSFKGTGAPSHVTIYHHGDIPKNTRYASGSVDPNWPQEVRSGWKSKDPNINRGRLHIYLVPHEDIIGAAGVEKEVFFRRGTPLNKKKRSERQQRRAMTKVEDEF